VTFAALLLAMMSALPLTAQHSKSGLARAAELLSGDWLGDGGGAPGQGAGEFSFRSELGGKALVRRNRAGYPATAGKPAFHHEDLMMIFQEAESQPVRALYLDSEGHVIHYSAVVVEDASSITFTSSPSNGEPVYRLSYKKAGDGTLAGRFETAPPGKPGAFSTYLQWTARRK
jgi:hypothetical protein